MNRGKNNSTIRLAFARSILEDIKIALLLKGFNDPRREKGDSHNSDICPDL